MIASQTNLAVDNALSRLVHDPSIRALRRGRAERVEEEGLPYIEANVISTWLNNTLENSRQRLERTKKRLVELEELISIQEKVFGCLDVLQSNTTRIKDCNSHLDELGSSLAMLENELERLTSASEILPTQLKKLKSLPLEDPHLVVTGLQDWIADFPEDSGKPLSNPYRICSIRSS